MDPQKIPFALALLAAAAVLLGIAVWVVRLRTNATTIAFLAAQVGNVLWLGDTLWRY